MDKEILDTHNSKSVEDRKAEFLKIKYNRLSRSMGVTDCIEAMYGGNVGAFSVLRNLACIPSHMISIVWLDHHGIYGSDIWTLFKEVCDGDISAMHKKLEDLDADLLILIKAAEEKRNGGR